jgi:dihydrofolate reductase
MRKLIVTEFVTLDGVMQGPGGVDEDRSGGFDKGGWCFQFWDDEPWKFKSDELASTGAILLGRETYEIFAGAWPTLTESEITQRIDEAGGDAKAIEAASTGDPFAERMNSLPKYVASTTLKDVAWNNSTLIKGDVAAGVRKLKEQPGENIFVHGSGTLVRSLMRSDLIDEYRLMVFPIVLGSGKRLFGDGIGTQPLRLVASTPFKSGVTVLKYEPAKVAAAVG